eukprot:12412665-Karenia_brevis.AAC.1
MARRMVGWIKLEDQSWEEVMRAMKKKMNRVFEESNLVSWDVATLKRQFSWSGRIASMENQR